MAYDKNIKYHFKLDKDSRRLVFCTTQKNQGLKGLFRGFFMASQHSSPSKSVTPVVYYEYSLKDHSLHAHHSHRHHSKWFIAGVAVVGLSLAWWLSQSNASYDERKVEYQALGFDAAAVVSPAATFPTLSDVFFNRMSAEITGWIQHANQIASASVTAVQALPVPSKNLQELSKKPPQALKIEPLSATAVAPAAQPSANITTAENKQDKDKESWLTLTVEKGDTLSNLFSRHEIRRADLYRLLQLTEHKKTLTRLRPGQEIFVQTNSQGQLLTLKKTIDYQTELLIKTADDETGFNAEILQRPVNRHLVSKAGLIEHSLFADARNAGVSSKKILELTRVFNWDIDFSQDLRKGDRFSLVYESLYSDGEHVKDDSILAAEFVNQGHVYQAVRYTDPDGHSAYYTPDGHSLQKAFIRNPLKVGQVTSKFNLQRRHPILNKIRAHKGVDYGAPTGTPIYATGQGRVAFAGYKNGYGNVVILEHWDDYTTLYAHMSGFAKNLKVGQKIVQEQEIGYVGQTGLATGPHLHYEFRINDEHQDPLTVKLPRAVPVAAEYKDDFLAKTQLLMAKLEQATQVALAEE